MHASINQRIGRGIVEGHDPVDVIIEFGNGDQFARRIGSIASTGAQVGRPAAGIVTRWGKVRTKVLPLSSTAAPLAAVDPAEPPVCRFSRRSEPSTNTRSFERGVAPTNIGAGFGASDPKRGLAVDSCSFALVQ